MGLVGLLVAGSGVVVFVFVLGGTMGLGGGCGRGSRGWGRAFVVFMEQANKKPQAVTPEAHYISVNYLSQSRLRGLLSA